METSGVGGGSGPSPGPSPVGRGVVCEVTPIGLLAYFVEFSLTEPTELTEPFCAQFRTHRRPSAYRVHRALLLKMGVMYVKEESSSDEKNHYNELSYIPSK